jgi:uncharacterized iron-regulated membrane protein
LWLHRWVGLFLAGFLILEGTTGSLLSFYDALDRRCAPEFHAVPAPAAAQLDVGSLVEQAAELVPQGRVTGVFLESDRAVVSVSSRDELGFSEIFLDPWTGQELGRRDWGNISQGRINLMPFIYKLHMRLALGPTGAWLLGVVALIWTLDCFVGFYLTLPVAMSRFWRRWRRSWLINRRAGFFRINFDLHRAGGLWLWPALLLFAWSSVMFNLGSVYHWVMCSTLSYPSPDSRSAPALTRPARPPRLGWRAAGAVGERLMAQQAARDNFHVVRPTGLYYSEEAGTYSYTVESNRALSDPGSLTAVTFHGDTGAIVTIYLPSRHKSGPRFNGWLGALHRAEVFGWPYRIFVCAMGLFVVLLSMTGIYIWWKKRRARKFASYRPRTAAPICV